MNTKAFLTAIILSVGVVVSCGKQNPSERNTPEEEKPTATQLKVISYNILYGMKYDINSNWSNFVNWIKSQDPDVMCYVEATFNPDEFASICERAGHKYYRMYRSKSTFSVALSSKYPITVVDTTVCEDSKIRGVFWARVQGVNFVPLHLWYEQSLDGDEIRKREMTTILKNTVKGHPELGKWVMCGDFNDQTKDDARWSNLNPSRKYELHEIIKKAGYKDCIRIMNPNDWCRTMQTAAYEGTGGAYRLDYIYATEELADCMSEAGRIKDSFTDNASDHYPIYTVFDMTKLKY